MYYMVNEVEVFWGVVLVLLGIIICLMRSLNRSRYKEYLKRVNENYEKHVKNGGDPESFECWTYSEWCEANNIDGNYFTVIACYILGIVGIALILNAFGFYVFE